MNRKFLISLVAIFITSSSLLAQQTTKFTAAKHNEYGLVYSLPTTHVEVEIEAQKTTKTAGPYYKYAKKYLNIENPITEDSQEWKLVSVNVRSYGSADKKDQYLMQFKSGSSPFLLVNEKGLPLSINIETEEPKEVKKAIKAPTKSVLDNNSYATALPGELLVSESVAKKAEIAATMIYKIRESRTNLITGEAEQMPPDGDAMKLTMQQLDKQESTLMALFIGTEKTENAIKQFDYVPMGDISDEVIARLSDYYGIVDRNNLSGDPIYLSIKITKKGEMPVNEKGEEKKLPKGAVIYNIPGEAQLTLKYDGKKLLDQKFDIAQFGIHFGLDPSMFTDKKAPAYVIFHSATGAIKELGTLQPESK
ncbi:MAG: DUF4831 family protein [Muribaculaceae bacterium]|nr:DUF4831 family protein [Muribaculaceae bacterium]